MKISCIITAYNEAPRIKRVLKVVTQFDKFDEIICVDDGSDDKTAEIIKSFTQVRLIEHLENQGKAAAVISGFEASKGDIICLLDADLENLTPKNLQQLVEPVLKTGCLSLACLEYPLYYFPIVLSKVEIWTGQRAFPRQLLTELVSKRNISYALESHINEAAINLNLPIFSIYWPGVTNTHKTQKIGLLNGWYRELAMCRDIFSFFPFYKFLWQSIYIPALSKQSLNKVTKS